MSGEVRQSAPQLSSEWIFDVKDLVNKAGLMRELDDTLPAPADLGVALIGVKPASPVEVDLRFEAVHEGVLATGSATVHVTGECGRCLDPIAYDLDVDLQELFFLPGRGQAGSKDTDDLMVQDDAIDLEPVLRDAVVTALPFQPVCREGCEGLCSECGIRLDENPGHHHDVVDPRWAALAGLADAVADEAPETKTNEMEER